MPKHPSPLKRLRHRFEVWAVRAAMATVPRLPRGLMLTTARAISTIAYLIDSRGRRVAMENLRLVFPEKDLAEKRRIARRSYQFLGISVFDLLWAPKNLNASNVANYVRYEVLEPESFTKSQHAATIWVTPHYGSFEWLSIAWALEYSKPIIIAEDFKNASLTTLFTQMREYSGVKVISQDRAMLRLLKHVKRGGQTAFLTDLRVKPSKAACIIHCFGFQTSVTLLHCFLAKQTGAPIMPVICLPQRNGTYVFRMYPVFYPDKLDSEQAIAQRCWDVFEDQIRENPEPWLWMYKHWRYLPEPLNQPYPSYARPNAQFTQMSTQASP